MPTPGQQFNVLLCQNPISSLHCLGKFWCFKSRNYQGFNIQKLATLRPIFWALEMATRDLVVCVSLRVFLTEYILALPTLAHFYTFTNE